MNDVEKMKRDQLITASQTPEFCDIERKEKEVLFHTKSELWNLLLLWQQV